MRSALAVGLSVAVALIVAWAGLHYDRALLDGGILLLAFIAILWLWTWGKPEPKPAGPSIRLGADPERDAALKQKELSRTINLTVSNARTAWSWKPGMGTAREQYPKLKALLLTVRKDVGLPIPPETTNATLNFDYSCRFLESVRPFIAMGHVDEAKAEAEKFIEKMNAALEANPTVQLS